MRVGLGVVVAVLIALAAAPQAAAATYAVTRTDDPAPNGCSRSDCSLREAVLAANAGAGGDTISLPGRHYLLTIAGTGEDAAATGDLDLTKDVTISGAGARSTVVDVLGNDRVFEVLGDVTATISDVTITGGQVASDGGGVRSEGTLTLVRDAIAGNRAWVGSGGGVASAGPSLTVAQSTIAGNDAITAGGIAFSNAASVTNSTISNNVAGWPGSPLGEGGGIAAGPGSTLILESSTLTNNQSFLGPGSGGGMAVQTALVRNSIVAHNVAHANDQSTGSVENCATPVDSGGNNLSDTLDCGFLAATDQQGVPVLLGPLADNGGPTDTEAVLPGSLALDAGAGCPAIDQRGISRPRGQACEIGAYEYAPPLATTNAASVIGFSTATLNGTVDPSWRPTSVHFEYGRTPEYGSRTPDQLVLGNGGVGVSAPLTGLRQGATYHFRLVAANGEGTTTGADQTFTTMDRTKPVLSNLRVVPGLFHRKNGATLAFTLSENATVTFRFDHVLRGVRRGKRCVKITRRNRHRRPCTRYLPVTGSVVQAGAEGPNSIHFDAKVETKLLRFGAYRLRATPRDAAGNVGKTALAAFRVLR